MKFSGRHYEKLIILISVRWYVAYPLSLRHVEEMMKERGAGADHSTIHRWVVAYAPELEKKFRNYKKPVGVRWRMDETYVKVGKKWKYLYRAVDAAGDTVDFLLTARRNHKAARRFLKKAMGCNPTPELINVDAAPANTAAVTSHNEVYGTTIEARQNKYMNNIVEQDHRGPKRIINPMLGSSSRRFASSARMLRAEDPPIQQANGKCCFRNEMAADMTRCPFLVTRYNRVFGTLATN